MFVFHKKKSRVAASKSMKQGKSLLLFLVVVISGTGIHAGQNNIPSSDYAQNDSMLVDKFIESKGYSNLVSSVSHTNFLSLQSSKSDL